MGKRILVVESGIPVIPFEQSILLRKEHELFRAYSGQETLEKLRELMPDLIVLDDRLDDIPALDLARQIRELPEGKHLSLLLLASTPSERPPDGINQVLVKPVIGSDFNEVCRRLLSVEARKESRLLVYVQVQGYLQSNLFLCNSLNLSASGILILTPRRLKVGDRLQLQITLPRERDKVRVTGAVVREAVEVGSRLNAYGVRFEDITGEDMDRLRIFVQDERNQARADML
jgi:CheY-like chemotaxis protein